jgi:D-proline reductase (dithiol) PrdB
MRLKNQLIAKIITRYPSLSKKFINSYTPLESKDVPWTPITKPLPGCSVAIVTTSGVHHKYDRPFNMNDPDGDPTYRVIDLRQPLNELIITHDYYDHTDADKDINIVFPVERLKEFKEERIIKALAQKHYSFMGHIVGSCLETLITETAPDVAQKIHADNVDIVLLTPG